MPKTMSLRFSSKRRGTTNHDVTVTLGWQDSSIWYSPKTGLGSALIWWKSLLVITGVFDGSQQRNERRFLRTLLFGHGSRGKHFLNNLHKVLAASF